VPGVEEVWKPGSIAQHSRVEWLFWALMTVMFRVFGAARERDRKTEKKERKDIGCMIEQGQQSCLCVTEWIFVLIQGKKALRRGVRSSVSRTESITDRHCQGVMKRSGERSTFYSALNDSSLAYVPSRIHNNAPKPMKTLRIS
jgi:hypothetical protein